MFVNTFVLLHTDVGDALRDISFRRSAKDLPLAQLKDAVSSQLDRLGVEVSVVDVTRPDPSLAPDNDFRIDWQSRAGGPIEHQHFDLTVPSEGWYVERWNQSGEAAKTAWACEAGNAKELVAATLRRGEIARVRPPNGATANEIESVLKMGRAERV